MLKEVVVNLTEQRLAPPAVDGNLTASKVNRRGQSERVANNIAVLAKQASGAN